MEDGCHPREPSGVRDTAAEGRAAGDGGVGRAFMDQMTTYERKSVKARGQGGMWIMRHNIEFGEKKDATGASAREPHATRGPREDGRQKPLPLQLKSSEEGQQVAERCTNERGRRTVYGNNDRARYRLLPPLSTTLESRTGYEPHLTHWSHTGSSALSYRTGVTRRPGVLRLDRVSRSRLLKSFSWLLPVSHRA